MTEPVQDADAALAGERTISPVAGFGLGRKGKAMGITALAAGCGLFMLATARHPKAKTADPLPPARQVVAFEPARPTLADPGPGAPQLVADAPPTAAPAAGAEAAKAIPREATARPQAPDPPLLADLHGGPSAAAPSGYAVPALAPEAAEVAAPPTPARAASPVPLARARRLPDRRFLILAGTAIPCVLETAMDSATPGLVTCVLPTDVASEDGTVVLLEKGTQVLGAYRAEMRPGQGRLAVAWTRAVTPGGVEIALASPAADALGRAGLDGAVDTHFWQRFGGALMLSAVDGATSALGKRAGAINLRLPSSAADTALSGALAIGPTLRKAPGAEVSILVAQDLDFSGVYGVQGR